MPSPDPDPPRPPALPAAREPRLPAYPRMGPWFLALRAFGTSLFRILYRLECRGYEKIPREGPVVLVSNHPSYLDPVLLCAPLDRRIVFVAWDALFGAPFVGGLARFFGALPIEVERPQKSQVASILRAIRDGQVVGIFPEGGRSFTREMGDVKQGAFRIALGARAPIVPVTIDGSFDIWSRFRPWPRFRGNVRITYHEPILPSAFPQAARRRPEAVMAEVRRRINAALRGGGQKA